jgi:hypothetical protein
MLEVAIKSLEIALDPYETLSGGSKAREENGNME